MTALAARKQLLIVESELNRAHMSKDLTVLTADARALASHAQSISTIASAAAVLVTGLTSFHYAKPAADPKPSRFQSLLKGVGLFSNLWQAIRSQDPEKKDEPDLQ